jgi:hypothetical protein
MAMIIELNEQTMPRSSARAKLGRRKEEVGIRLKPRRGMLYALSFMGACLLIAGEVFFASTAWRSAWDLTTAGAILGAIKLWMQANRLALAMEGRADITTATPQDTTEMPGCPNALSTLRKRAA